MIKIIIYDKTNHTKKTYFSSEQEVFIGRSQECDIIIEDANVSRKHLVIKVKEKSLLVQDYKSSYGLMWKGKKVKEVSVEEFEEVIHISKNTFLKVNTCEQTIDEDYPQNQDTNKTFLMSSEILSKIEILRNEAQDEHQTNEHTTSSESNYNQFLNFYFLVEDTVGRVFIDRLFSMRFFNNKPHLFYFTHILFIALFGIFELFFLNSHNSGSLLDDFIQIFLATSLFYYFTTLTIIIFKKLTNRKLYILRTLWITSFCIFIVNSLKMFLGLLWGYTLNSEKVQILSVLIVFIVSYILLLGIFTFYHSLERPNKNIRRNTFLIALLFQCLSSSYQDILVSQSRLFGMEHTIESYLDNLNEKYNKTKNLSSQSDEFIMR